MRYQKYEKSDKAYIVMRCSGFGTMEDNYVDEEIVFETNDKEEAYKESRRLLHENNSEETIKSSWIPNTYWVHANLNTEIGKAEYEEFLKQYKNKTEISYCNPKSYKITGKTTSEIIWDGKNWKHIN